jgi:hypothetical protein
MIDRSFLIEQVYRSLDTNEQLQLDKFASMDKEAVLPLLANLGRLIGIGARTAPAAGAVGAAAGVAKAAPGFGENALSMLGFGGRQGTWAHRFGAPLSIIPGIGGREGAATALGFGGLGSVLGAAMPGEGQSRWESAARGFGSGVLGGIGWEMGSRGFGRALDRFVPKGGTGAFSKARGLNWGDVWNRTTGSNFGKLTGAKTLMSAGGLAAGIGGSAGLEHLYSKASGGSPPDPYSFKGFKATTPGGMVGATGGITAGGIQGGF